MAKTWPKCVVLNTIRVLYNYSKVHGFFILRGVYMFDDEILEEIFAAEETRNIPICEQSIMIQVISRVLIEKGVIVDATICES